MFHATSQETIGIGRLGTTRAGGEPVPRSCFWSLRIRHREGSSGPGELCLGEKEGDVLLD